MEPYVDESCLILIANSVEETMAIVETTQAKLEADVKDVKPVLLLFTAPWCGPCRTLYPHLERFACEFDGRIKVMKINADRAIEARERFRIRGIPQMVFFVNGNEYARLNEVTVTRMSLTANQWLDDLGLNVRTNYSTAQRVTESDRIWLSFAGDPAVKEVCIARLRTKTEKEVSPPSDCLAGGPDQFEIVIGAPTALGSLLDAVPRTRLMEIVEAMPVGADLRQVTPDVLYEFVYASEWAVMPGLTGPGAELATEIMMLHKREREGLTIPADAWDAIRRSAVHLRQAETQSIPKADMLEALAWPQYDWPVNDVLHGMRILCGVRSFPELTEALGEEIRRAHIEDSERLDSELGEPPSGGGEAREIWSERYRERQATLERQRRAANPKLWSLYDRYVEHFNATTVRLGSEVACLLLKRLGENSLADNVGGRNSVRG
ncbi:thioredoxin family protein [Paraburkholderia humisilvae]|nr:thioredoxin family protein [Paraburkholderia humisilvae]